MFSPFLGILGLLLIGCLDQQEKGPKQDGLSLMSGKGECLVCHSLDGKKKLAPTFKGLYKKKVKVIQQGKSEPQWVIADEAYLRRSILSPEAEVVVGYPNIMRSYNQVLSQKELETIIQYIKKLK